MWLSRFSQNKFKILFFHSHYILRMFGYSYLTSSYLLYNVINILCLKHKSHFIPFEIHLNKPPKVRITTLEWDKLVKKKRKSWHLSFHENEKENAKYYVTGGENLFAFRPERSNSTCHWLRSPILLGTTQLKEKGTGWPWRSGLWNVSVAKQWRRAGRQSTLPGGAGKDAPASCCNAVWEDNSVFGC